MPGGSLCTVRIGSPVDPVLGGVKLGGVIVCSCGGSPICWCSAMWISPSGARCPMNTFRGSVFLMYSGMILVPRYAVTFWPTSQMILGS